MFLGRLQPAVEALSHEAQVTKRTVGVEPHIFLP